MRDVALRQEQPAPIPLDSVVVSAPESPNPVNGRLDASQNQEVRGALGATD
jgi:hypothetical protein